ncbi:cystinosin [Scenedesmus sp. PABB004]|nr:cystinosin [Scenedesmus sp. PABB004]
MRAAARGPARAWAPGAVPRPQRRANSSSALRALRARPAPAPDAGDAPGESAAALGALAVSLVGGAALGGGLGLGLDPALPAAVAPLSASLGWAYTIAWTLSFYPQVLDNARRRSVSGLSVDYLVYSSLGYAAYTAYTAALYFSPGVAAAYAAAHGGAASDVQLMDCLFAGHALAVSGFTLLQAAVYGGGADGEGEGEGGAPPAAAASQRAQQPAQQPAAQQQPGWRGLGTSRVCQATALGVVAAVAAYGGHIGRTCGGADCDAWLPLLSALGGIKVTMTLVKYTPQAVMNATRRSTEGWSIGNVLLDLAGGLLSFGQVGLNALARGDATVITGNPAKLGIAAISIAFDLLFAAQHYLLYPHTTTQAQAQPQPPRGRPGAEAAQGQGGPPDGSGGGGSGERAAAGARRPALAARRVPAVAAAAAKPGRGKGRA